MLRQERNQRILIQHTVGNQYFPDELPRLCLLHHRLLQLLLRDLAFAQQQVREPLPMFVAGVLDWSVPTGRECVGAAASAGATGFASVFFPQPSIATSLP